MKREKILVLSSTLCLLLVFLVACGPGATPTPTVTTPTVTPPSPAATKPPTPTPSPTSKPSPTPTPVSFAGKVVNLVVPLGAASGTDIMARVYAKYLPKFLPGNPSMVVRNMPGGQATIGANFVYSAKPDGLTVLVTGPTTWMSYATGVSGVHYDLTKMDAILGNASGTVVFASSQVVKKIEDLPNAKGLRYGGTMATGHYMFVTLMKLLGVRIDKLSLAYAGAGDTWRAFLAGELNMAVYGAAGYTQNVAPYVQKGEVVLLYQTGVLGAKGELVRDPGLAVDVPTAKELYERLFGKPPSGIAWDTYMALAAVGPSFQDQMMLPPGVPDSIKRAYWDAAQKALQDPEFRKVLGGLIGATAPWSAGEAFSQTFKSAMKIDPKVLEWLDGALREYGVKLK